ncbi:hypothetical protein J7T55_002892 [Diaporthe amygdali]|uniref:uncharacterized protein n=1 Tax=Phomopsis amygdali TaxID=1214568 RepID=UPI0022FEA622|nr:uncharacterized protein J7T55_002892 [Diaporthe amygdali]KAJ0122379.1 hypothetical protein J7T55_002892 [Diaporthe amygdali]
MELYSNQSPSTAPTCQEPLADDIRIQLRTMANTTSDSSYIPALLLHIPDIMSFDASTNLSDTETAPTMATFTMTHTAHTAEMTRKMRDFTLDAGGEKVSTLSAEACATSQSSESRLAAPNNGPADVKNQHRPFDPLPLELREQIWDFALATTSPGIYFFHEQDLQYGDAYDQNDPCWRVIVPIPTIYHLCKETREHTKRKLSFTWARTKRGERLRVPCRQFNPDIDAAYLSSKTVDQLYNSIHDPAEAGPFMEIQHLALESRCLCNAQWPRFARLLSRLGTPNVLPKLELMSVILGRAWIREEPPIGRSWDGEEPLTPPPGVSNEEYSSQVAEELQEWFEKVEPPFKLRSRAGIWGPELIPGDPDSRRDIEEICWMFQDQMIPLDQDENDANEAERQSRLEVGPFREVVLSAEDFRKRWPANVNFMELVVAKYC